MIARPRAGSFHADGNVFFCCGRGRCTNKAGSTSVTGCAILVQLYTHKTIIFVDGKQDTGCAKACLVWHPFRNALAHREAARVGCSARQIPPRPREYIQRKRCQVGFYMPGIRKRHQSGGIEAPRHKAAEVPRLLRHGSALLKTWGLCVSRHCRLSGGRRDAAAAAKRWTKPIDTLQFTYPCELIN